MTQHLKSDLSRWLLVASVLATFFISRDLWLANSRFPMIPAFGQLPVAAHAAADLCFYALAVCVLLFGFFPNRWLLLPILAFFAILIQADINRLQPTHYIFALALCCHVFPKRRILLLIVLFSGIYFWSGLHKFNPYFLEKWLGGLDKRIPFVPDFLRAAFTYMVPVIEAGAGLMLLHLRLRKFAAITLVLMHLLILATLIREHGGLNVVPLNVFMIGTLLRAIFTSDVHVVALFDKKAAFLALVVWMLPILNLFGSLDHFLSFSIMSGKPQYAIIYFPDRQASENIPASAKPYVRNHGNRYYIQLAEWAGYTKKIMVYPEERVYNAIKDSLTRNFPDAQKAKTELHLYKP